MAKLITADFTLNAVLKGITLVSKVGLDTANGVGFFQFLDKGTGELSPDWSNNSTYGPKFYAIVQDTKGRSYLGESVHLFYNGVEVQFNSQTGISENTSALLNGKIQKTVDAGTGVTYFQFIDNIFNLANNSDNDYFYMTGNATLAGGAIQQFRTPVQDVVVVMSAQGGDAYHLVAESENITEDHVGTVTPKLYSRENPTTPITSLPAGSSYKFYNVTGGTEEECTAQSGYSIVNNVLQIPADKVHGVDAFRVEITINNIKYSAIRTVADETDPYYLQVVESGNAKKEYIDEGETVVYSPQVVDKEGNIVTGASITPNWTVYKGNGSLWSEKSGAGGTIGTAQHAISFTYNEIAVTAGGKISGYLTGTPSV